MKRTHTRCNQRCWVPVITSLAVIAIRVLLHRAWQTNWSLRDLSSLVPKPLPPHPFYGRHPLCGDGAWLDAYRRVHAASKRSRVLVSVGVEAGLGDRLLGVMSEFFWAVLSDRAFLLTTYADGTLPRWDAAVEPALFDWRAEESDFPESLTAPLHYTYRGDRGFGGDRSYGPGVDAARDAQFYMVNRNREVFGKENMSAFGGFIGGPGAGRERLFVSSNRGGVALLFENLHHADWMRRVAGLTPSTAWACGWRALFAPGPVVLATYARIFEQLRRLGGRCVSVNVRAGDEILAGRAGIGSLSPSHEAVFECAAKASAALSGGAPGAVVPWYLTSDSPDLRRLALERWGPAQVITDPTARYVHGDCLHHRHPCTPDLQNASIVHAFGQLYATTLCSAHIFDTSSSFGRAAAFATPGAALYTFNFRGQCSLQTIEAVSAAGAGL